MLIFYRVNKILKLRLFDNGEKKWHYSVSDMSYEILSISQFTLCYKLKGNKLDFHMTMPGNLAQESYQYFLNTLRKSYDESKIKGKTLKKLLYLDYKSFDGLIFKLEIVK